MKVVIIAVLLMLSAICSATETAFSSCNRIRLKKLADDGNKSAKKAMNICDNFDKALTAILVGNNVVNISSSSLATVLFTEKFGKGSVGLATVVMTVLVLIFGEILPKSLAKENSERFSILMAAPLSAFMFIITPITAIFMGIKSGVSKLVGNKNSEPSVTEEELKYIIDEIQDEGVLEEQESELVRSALDFDEITISEILVPRVNIEGVELHEDMESIKKRFVQTKFSRLPVYDKDLDHIVGLIHQSDFFEMYLKGKTDISLIMNKPLYITENRKISEILKQMQRKKVHMAVVLDQYGGTEGICTLEDIIEELVGEIYDESDEEDTSLVKISDGVYEASAELSVSDFLDRIGLPEDTIETERTSLGGWIMDMLDRLPEQNEVISCPPFENLKARRRRKKMPKQIKKEQIKKSELLYRKWSVAGLAAAAVFMGCMAGLMSMIVKTEGAKVPTIVLFAAFIIYTAVSVVCAVLGVKSYVKDDCGVCLFQGIVHIYSVIACVMNVRMAFIILFSALGSRSGVDTLIGSQSQNEFIQSQYASWICLAIATLFSVILGILAVVWLVKNKKN